MFTIAALLVSLSDSWCLIRVYCSPQGVSGDVVAGPYTTTRFLSILSFQTETISNAGPTIDIVKRLWVDMSEFRVRLTWWSVIIINTCIFIDTLIQGPDRLQHHALSGLTTTPGFVGSSSVASSTAHNGTPLASVEQDIK